MHWLERLHLIDVPEHTSLHAAELSWRGLLPVWLAALLLLAASAGVVFLYLRENARLGVLRRSLLAGLRIAIVALVLVLLVPPGADRRVSRRTAARRRPARGRYREHEAARPPRFGRGPAARGHRSRPAAGHDPANRCQAVVSTATREAGEPDARRVSAGGAHQRRAEAARRPGRQGAAARVPVRPQAAQSGRLGPRVDADGAGRLAARVAGARRRRAAGGRRRYDRRPRQRQQAHPRRGRRRVPRQGRAAPRLRRRLVPRRHPANQGRVVAEHRLRR